MNLLHINIPQTVATLSQALALPSAEGMCNVPITALRDAVALFTQMGDSDYFAWGLTPTESRIYRRLGLAFGHDVSYDDLMIAAGIETRDSLWVHVRRLRIKLAAHGEQIFTVHQRGYRLVKEGNDAS